MDRANPQTYRSESEELLADRGGKCGRRSNNLAVIVPLVTSSGSSNEDCRHAYRWAHRESDAKKRWIRFAKKNYRQIKVYLKCIQCCSSIWLTILPCGAGLYSLLEKSFLFMNSITILISQSTLVLIGSLAVSKTWTIKFRYSASKKQYNFQK